MGNRDNPVLCKAVKSILDLSHEVNIRKFSMALADSLQMDQSGNNPPDILSPFDIEEIHGIPIGTQISYGIALTKKAASDFLQHLGMNITHHTIKREFTKGSYRKAFPNGKPGTSSKAPTGPRGALACTYAEWLHWTRCPFSPPKLPKEIKEFA